MKLGLKMLLWLLLLLLLLQVNSRRQQTKLELRRRPSCSFGARRELWWSCSGVGEALQARAGVERMHA